MITSDKPLIALTNKQFLFFIFRMNIFSYFSVIFKSQSQENRIVFFYKMFTRKLRNLPVWKLPRPARFQSTQSQEAVVVDIDGKTGISTLSLNEKPVNSLTLNLLKDFCEKMDLLEKEKAKGMIRGMILTSVSRSTMVFKVTVLKI